jgi:hypothetical protein
VAIRSYYRTVLENASARNLSIESPKRQFNAKGVPKDENNDPVKKDQRESAEDQSD